LAHWSASALSVVSTSFGLVIATSVLSSAVRCSRRAETAPLNPWLGADGLLSVAENDAVVHTIRLTRRAIPRWPGGSKRVPAAKLKHRATRGVDWSTFMTTVSPLSSFARRIAKLRGRIPPSALLTCELSRAKPKQAANEISHLKARPERAENGVLLLFGWTSAPIALPSRSWRMPMGLAHSFKLLLDNAAQAAPKPGGINTDALISGVVHTLVYVFIGLVVFLLAFFLITKITPFSIRKEIEEDQNTSLGIVIGSVIIGLSIIIAAAISG
jgi:putative membrane protein